MLGINYQEKRYRKEKFPSADLGHFTNSHTLQPISEANGSNVKLFIVRRQTVLFSATQTRNVEDLARVSLKKSPLYVKIEDDTGISTVSGLEQVP